jgi:hypothetical protein
MCVCLYMCAFLCVCGPALPGVWGAGNYTLVTLLLHCCYTVVTLLLHCWYTVVTLLLHCRYTVVTLFLAFPGVWGAGHHRLVLLHP